MENNFKVGDAVEVKLMGIVNKIEKDFTAQIAYPKLSDVFYTVRTTDGEFAYVRETNILPLLTPEMLEKKT